MRNTILLFLLTLLIPRANAEGCGMGPDFGGKCTVSWGMVSQYRTGNGLVHTKDPAAWGDFAITFQNGITLDLWGLGNPESTGDEVDLSLAWSRFLSHGVKMTVGIQYYDINNLFSDEGGDLITSYVRFSKEVLRSGPHSLNLTLDIQGQYFTRSTGMWFDKIEQHVSYSYAVAPGVTIGLDTAVVLVNTITGHTEGSGGVAFSEKFGVAWSLTPRSTIQAFVSPFTPIADLSGRSSTVGGVSFSYSF